MIFLKISVFEMSLLKFLYILCVLGYMYDEERRGECVMIRVEVRGELCKALLCLQLYMGAPAQPWSQACSASALPGEAAC